MRRTCLSDLQIARYHQVPTFGGGTICKFSNNASGMKQFAGQDYEDLLQVCNTSVTMPNSLTLVISAQSPSSKDSFQRSMTKLSWTYYLN
jgi:hypothetical protein